MIKVKSSIADAIITNGISTLEIATKLEELSEQVREKISIEFEIMGDNRYAVKRGFDVYEGAATNANGVAGAFAAGGIGLGAATAMGTTLNQIVGNPMEQEKVRECPGCHRWVSITARFCAQCGYSFQQNTCICF